MPQVRYRARFGQTKTGGIGGILERLTAAATFFRENAGNILQGTLHQLPPIMCAMAYISAG